MFLFSILRKQGIRGTPYRIFSGDIPKVAEMVKDARFSSMGLSHNILPRAFPHYAAWSEIYGSQFVYWYGATPRLTVPDPEHVRQVLSNSSGHFDKLPRRPDVRDFLDKGLFSIKGETWVFHRRVLSPAFRKDSLNHAIPMLLEGAEKMLEIWRRMISEGVTGSCEVDVFEDFRSMTADVIGRLIFGTSSHKEGTRMLEALQRQQQVLISETDLTVYVPGSRFWPTRRNRLQWSLQRQIRESLLRIIKNRSSMDVEKYDDLLGRMLAANDKQEKRKFSMDEVIGECSSFFLAGHEATSNLLTWTMMLLAEHQEWQERARAEVLNCFGRSAPINAEGLHQLKIVTMVLNESLRLYPPAAMILRYACNDTKVGDIKVGKGTCLVLPILAIHHDEKIWGEDAKDFKPERFSNEGETMDCGEEERRRKWRQRQSYMPFSVGERVCLGNNFVMVQAKVVLAAMLQHFSFTLSPIYRHAPINILTIQPQHGLPIILKPL